MRVHVELSADPLVDFWVFCKAIAQATCPTGEQGLEGIDCIVQKVATYRVPVAQSVRNGDWPFLAGLPSVSTADNGGAVDKKPQLLNGSAEAQPVELPQATPANPEIVELVLPYKLEDADRRALEKLLPQLPKLRYPMSEDDAAAFMQAYFRLKDRPTWEPVLVNAKTIEQRKREQDALMLHHLQSLRQEFAQGRVVAVDSRHVPVAALNAGYYIPREQAIAYLNRIGIVWRIRETVDDCSVTESPERETRPASGKTRRRVGEPMLSEQQKREIVERHEELRTSNVKGFCKKTADEFGLSRRWVYELVKEAEAAKQAGKIDHLLASGGK